MEFTNRITSVWNWVNLQAVSRDLSAKSFQQILPFLSPEMPRVAHINRRHLKPNQRKKNKGKLTSVWRMAVRRSSFNVHGGSNGQSSSNKQFEWAAQMAMASRMSSSNGQLPRPNCLELIIGFPVVLCGTSDLHRFVEDASRTSRL